MFKEDAPRLAHPLFVYQYTLSQINNDVVRD